MTRTKKAAALSVENLEGKLLMSAGVAAELRAIHHAAVVEHQIAVREARLLHYEITHHLIKNTSVSATPVGTPMPAAPVVATPAPAPTASTTVSIAKTAPVPVSVPVTTVSSPPVSHPAASSGDPSTTVVQNGLSMTLSVDQSNYSLGSPVNMTFTETNDTSSAMRVTTGPSIDGFTITQNGAEVWRSNSGPTPMFLMVRTLQPGQSITFNATWTASQTGTFTVTQQSAPSGPTVNFTVS